MVYSAIEVQDLLTQYTSLVVAELDIDEIWLFGSYAEGSPHEDSDIDLAVVSSVFPKQRYQALNVLYQKLWNVPGVPNIEIHVFSPEGFHHHFFGKAVQLNGKRIWQRQRVG